MVQGTGGRWWVPGYGSVVDPDVAKVATIIIGFGFAGCAFPLLTVLLPHPAIRWTVFWFIAAIALVEAVVMVSDLRGLIGSEFRPAPPAKTLAQVLAAVVATGLANYVGVGTHSYFYALILLPVLIAAVVGNGAFLAVVWLATMGMLVGTALAAGVPTDSLPILLISCGVAALAGGVMVHMLQVTLLRVYHMFLRLAETTDVVLRAAGFDEALAQFLPLVAAQADVRRVDAYWGDATRMELIASCPRGGSVPATPIPPGAVSVQGGQGRTVTGFTIGADTTTIFSVGTSQQVVVLVLNRGKPGWYSETAYRFSVNRLAAVLGLLVQHQDFLDRLDLLGSTDGLTGLANRRTLTARLEAELSEARLRDRPFTLAMIDLDLFKDYNDTFGHQLGDVALIELGRLLRARARETDLVARYGGEEFCVVLPDTNLEEATRWMGEVQAQARALPTRRPLTCSVGLASSEGHDRVDAVLRAADTALYGAKAAGRDRIMLATAPPDRPGWGFRVDADPYAARPA